MGSAYEGEHFVFIVGSPRSGTTIAAETLARHPELAYLYEPYYLWNRGSGSGDDDERGASDLDEATVAFIREACHGFWQRSGARFVVEQSPEESLMLPLMRRVLPRARFVHLVRDGYDCIRSIAEEWRRREDLVAGRNPFAIARKALEALARQPSWRFRMLQLHYELSESGVLRPWAWVNKSKWKGAPGWGVRIPGWQEILEREGRLVLNTLQWSYTVERVLEFVAELPPEATLELRYEDLAGDAERTLDRLQAWIGVTPRPGLGADVHAGSLGRGRRSIPPEDLAVVTPRIAPLMERLGYDVIR